MWLGWGDEKCQLQYLPKCWKAFNNLRRLFPQNSGGKFSWKMLAWNTKKVEGHDIKFSFREIGFEDETSSGSCLVEVSTSRM
jgi:hypothetical protein